jgi:hypothetical protein
MRAVKINTKLLTDAVISGLVVKQLPKLVKQFVTLPAGNVGDVLVGSGAAYLVGMFMKKPNIATVGIAFALDSIVNDLVTGIFPETPETVAVVTPTKVPAGMLHSSKDVASLSEYMRLSEYISPDQMQIKSFDQYEKFYN